MVGRTVPKLFEIVAMHLFGVPKYLSRAIPNLCSVRISEQAVFSERMS